MDEKEEVNVDDKLNNTEDLSKLSKHERKLIKKHQKQEEIKERQDNTEKKERKNNIIKYSAIILIILAIAFIGYKLFSNLKDSNQVSTNNITANDKVKGDLNAPVTIIEYSDFECPFCKRFFLETLPLIKKQYIDTGKVKFVYKHFPLSSIHFNAQLAAEASECANEQNKFWEYHDLLFENSPNLRESDLVRYASQINLDMDKFKGCLKSGRYKGIIGEELREGSKNGVTGTPGFLINGKLISGAQPFNVFKQAIESNLN
ncbi:DsbA family protein [Candidatus Woesearchaeota archaeon]|nr:DsbA family protein [Candidatus Woesearchaeota archaeon]